ncbi:hypothetical protein GIY23_18235 [Allosaccharopolyspora coralli]|uniref:Uncharacterized protein n=1 Tax=Allosaccharopolyspora coralli TaxID=2665642 RepID=A0A5Q3Q947_9PSEU|nr:hypothetical protein [Allosaccharopolyspora coralli]QGK71201.1 hypothetical protein GIY23_18235 [Allosaccharopolyspora coralli]
MSERGQVWRCRVRTREVLSRVAGAREDAEKLSRVLDEDSPSATRNIPFIVAALLDAESRLEDTAEELEAL